MVFSHNDILFGNIIYNQVENSIKFIDYEYCDINYQAYDIANHFNEFAGLENVDYGLFPSRDYQIKWLRVYLDAFYSRVNQFYAQQMSSNMSSIVIDDRFVENFYEEVGVFTLLSHFMWAVWALVQAQSSLIDFNFVKYANIRFDEYLKNKSTWIK